MSRPFVIDRRRFVAAAGALALRPVPALGATPMLTRTVRAAGQTIPVIGLGTWQTFDIGTDAAERAQRRRVLEILFQAGGSVIDSSPMYGRSEAVVGDLLAAMGARDKAYLATKVWTHGAAAGITQMQTSITRMRSGVMDLMQIHNLVDWRTHLKTLRQWKEEGRIRAIGITHYTVSGLDELAAVIRAEPVDYVQLVHSIMVRAAEDRLLPLAAERGIGVIVNQPFGQGSAFRAVRGKPLPPWAADHDIASWAQFLLKFVVSHPAVTCVIPGTARPEHMTDNVAAGLGRLPDAATRERMAALWATL